MKTATMEPVFVTSNYLARRTGVKRPAISELCRVGIIPAVKGEAYNSPYRIRKDDADRVAESLLTMLQPEDR